MSLTALLCLLAWLAAIVFIVGFIGAAKHEYPSDLAEKSLKSDRHANQNKADPTEKETPC